MSDTKAPPPAPASDTLPGFVLEQKMETIDGASCEVLYISWNGRTGPRQVTARVLDMGTQWDVLEIIGRGLDNPGWINMAMTAACVTDIDGKPIMGAMSRDRFRQTLNRLGEQGVRAVNLAMVVVATKQAATEAAEKVAVGN